MTTTMTYVVYATISDAVFPHRWIVVQNYRGRPSPQKSFATYNEADKYRREENARWGKARAWSKAPADYIPAGARDADPDEIAYAYATRQFWAGKLDIAELDDRRGKIGFPRSTDRLTDAERANVQAAAIHGAQMTDNTEAEWYRSAEGQAYAEWNRLALRAGNTFLTEESQRNYYAALGAAWRKYVAASQLTGCKSREAHEYVHRGWIYHE